MIFLSIEIREQNSVKLNLYNLYFLYLFRSQCVLINIDEIVNNSVIEFMKNEIIFYRQCIQ